MVVHRLIGVYLAVVASLVAVQFVVFPLYAYDSDGEVMSSAVGIWHVLDWLMAAGLVLMLVTTCRERQRHGADKPTEVRPWLRSNVMFYGTLLLTLAFIPNWFASSWGHNANPTIWHLIDTVLPVMFAVEAHRLWRASSV